MLFDIPFIADWKTIGEHRQKLTDCNTDQENEGRIDYDYKVGEKILVRNKGTIRKAYPCGKKTHGQLRQSIRMEISWFNVEIKKNE